MNPSLFYFKRVRLACLLLLTAALVLCCGLNAFAAESTPEATLTEPGAAESPTPTPAPATEPVELFPTDVQTVEEDDFRQIIKTYILSGEQTPAAIPRDEFTRDGWRYTLTDITEKRISGADTRSHTEAVEINTETKDLNEIITLLSPTLEYESEDGYVGTLTLDLASVSCVEAGYTKSSYTVTATREYPYLSTNDLSLIPKTVTDNGRTLTLEDVSWEAQHTTNVDYQEIPDSYLAVAKYTGSASKSVVTGYITTAAYSGELTKVIVGDVVYTAYFSGVNLHPTPKPTATPSPTPQPAPAPAETPEKESGEISPLFPIIMGILFAAMLSGISTAFFFRRNIKIYKDNFRVLEAKVRITAKDPVIDLSPLDGSCFGIEIDKFAAKSLNGVTVEVRHGTTGLKHKIAYEGNAYRMEANFAAKSLKAIY